MTDMRLVRMRSYPSAARARPQKSLNQEDHRSSASDIRHFQARSRPKSTGMPQGLMWPVRTQPCVRKNDGSVET